ncbi:exodeoxyribonuclease VII large subunit [Heyndrickxia sporothermodurans]|uniref:exodeoxyribonuclease VII large subunit n=1 Tax=Heyndrickxia sporothermodurans TaxID=46224 RepID=UPI002DBF6D26|nr:exodeoxyribonuclease VII large subunit [Heyndrickxia sporothermodurans]MEB6547548.1 exodeoxyribonuclease VII large subunit [Heyndrickxia sporothermodurans]MED3654236.1 exodeoxyribonuclease VII large subunit [Heyndrickxia sporothermodurans]
MTTKPYLTVHALTKYIKRKFDVDPHLVDIHVKGEISNYKQHSSGHMYFTLKDDKARILAVMFSKSNKVLKFKPENGMNVLIQGQITVYEGSGQYQLYVKQMQPDGIGELYLAYEQLKTKLSQEGLFALERKRKLPPYPKNIGVITSPTGAAVRDIISTIKRRYPIGKIKLIPALVQGENAAKSIANAIEKMNEMKEIDVLIVGRGGGSIEELWAFNEEIVARAIFNSKIPIISAVGHETDFTIADFVADLRAPTPTGAAELAVPHIEEIMEKLLNRKSRLIRGFSEIVQHQRKRLQFIKRSYVFRNPNRLYEQKMEYMDHLTERLTRQMNKTLQHEMTGYEQLAKRLQRNQPHQLLERGKEKHVRLNKELRSRLQAILQTKQQEFSKAITALEALSPLKVMERGYSLAYTPEKEIIKSIEQTSKGEEIQVMVSDGKIICSVENIEKG